MTDREQGFVLGWGDGRCIPGHVHIGDIADVVTVSFQPADHRILCIEDPVLCNTTAGTTVARGERPVVTHLGRMASRVGSIAYIEAVATIAIVGLPSGIRGLEHDIRRGGIIAHDEDDMTGSIVVRACQFGDVYARNGRGGNGPGTGDRPVATIDDSRGGIGQAARL